MPPAVQLSLAHSQLRPMAGSAMFRFPHSRANHARPLDDLLTMVAKDCLFETRW